LGFEAEEGGFKMPRIPEGRYKFKVTKDGYKALSGGVMVDKYASSKSDLLFKFDNCSVRRQPMQEQA
jgi:hypothetical protein